MTTHYNFSLHGATFQPLAFCSPGGCTSQWKLINVPSPAISLRATTSVCAPWRVAWTAVKPSKGPPASDAHSAGHQDDLHLHTCHHRVPTFPAAHSKSHLCSSAPTAPHLSSFTLAEQSCSCSRCGNLGSLASLHRSPAPLAVPRSSVHSPVSPSFEHPEAPGRGSLQHCGPGICPRALSLLNFDNLWGGLCSLPP